MASLIPSAANKSRMSNRSRGCCLTRAAMIFPAYKSANDTTWISAKPNIVACSEAINARDGRWLMTAGVVLVRQKPGSAKGVMFITIEDETGPANLVVFVREAPPRGPRIVDDGDQFEDPARGRRGPSRATAALRSVGRPVRACRPRHFTLPTGRGDEFAHGGGPNPRDKPKPAIQPPGIFIPDLHNDTLKVKARNFH